MYQPYGKSKAKRTMVTNTKLNVAPSTREKETNGNQPSILPYVMIIIIIII
jgi:hypothetical protein